jgi:hypothetical protein
MGHTLISWQLWGKLFCMHNCLSMFFFPAYAPCFVATIDRPLMFAEASCVLEPLRIGEPSMMGVVLNVVEQVASIHHG